AHLAAVPEGHSLHVAEDEERVARAVGEAAAIRYGAGVADRRKVAVGVHRVAEDLAGRLERAAARMMLHRGRRSPVRVREDVVACTIRLRAELSPDRAVHVECSAIEQ